MHADAPRAVAVASNKKQNSLSYQYVAAVVSYPASYPTKASQMYSIFVEVAYAGYDSEQVRYEQLEVNLVSIREAGLYDGETNAPLLRTDPRLSLGDDISIISFTKSGY